MIGCRYFLFLLCLASTSVLRAQKITLKVQNASPEVVFRQIEQQSGFYFTYTKEQLVGCKPITVNLVNVSLKEALDECLKNQPIDWELVGNAIIIRKRTGTGLPGNEPDSAIILPEIRGLVTDETDGLPLFGASFQLRGSRAGGMTGQNGDFILVNTSIYDTLEITYVGYIPRILTFSAGQTVMAVSLKRASVQLAPTVVNTGLYKRPVGNFTGASHTVTGTELKTANPTNIFMALTALDPAIRISENNTLGGDLNALPVIQVRGQNNLPVTTQGGSNNTIATPVSAGDIMAGYLANPNEPLMILDGFQTTLQSIYDLDINRIERVTILKDAAATVAYGSRAANGVIVVETKKPSGGKMQLTYSLNMNVQSPDLQSYNLMNASELLEAQLQAGIYHSTNYANDIALKQWYDYRLYQVQSGVNTDWIAQPAQNGLGWGNNINLGGGNRAVRYNLNMYYNTLSGAVRGSSRETFGLSAYIGFSGRNTRFSNSMQVTTNKATNSKWGSFSTYAQQLPFFRPYDSAGNVLKMLEPGPDVTGIPLLAPGSPFPNPMNDATLNSKDFSTYQLFTNSSLFEWTLSNNLRLNASFHLYSQLPEAEQFLPPTHSSFTNNGAIGITELGSYTQTAGKNEMMEGRLGVDYNQKKADHTLFFAGGVSAQETRSSSTSIVVTGIPNDYLDQPGLASGYPANAKPYTGFSSTRSITTYGSISYNYKNLYSLEGTANASGSSQFGANNRLAPFGAIGAGWNISEEGFFPDNHWVDNLKLLATYGVTGNQNFAAYMAQPIYQYNLQNNYRLQTGAALQGFANDDLKWQQTRKTNFALNSALWKGLLQLRFDYYLENTNNLILPVGVAPSTGFISYQDNLGETSNNGYEVLLSIAPVRNTAKNIFWTIILNGGYYKNTIKSLSPAIEALNNAANAGTVNQKVPQPRFEVGQSMTRLWAVRSLGIDPATGNELLLKRDGTTTFTWDPADKVPVGDYSSKYKGTIGSNFTYKALTINILFGFEGGGQLYNQTLADKIENVDLRESNGDKRVLNGRWKLPGDHVFFKSLAAANTVTYATSRFVQDNNHLEGSSLSVQYAFPATADWLNTLPLASPRVYFTLNNAFRISTVAMERGTAFPFTRTFNFGITTSFK